MRRTTTMEEIGRELGISAMTVSRALNGHPSVREETRRKVLDLAARQNYRPNRLARSLVTSRSMTVGIVVPDLSHSFFADMTQGAQAALELHGYDMMLCHSHGDPERERSAIDALLGSRVDGLIVASEQTDPEAFRLLRDERVPYVLLDRFFPGLDAPCVRTDDCAVGRIATEYLLGLGHMRIGHIRGKALSTGRLRHEGYEQALRAHGIPPNAEWIAYGDFTVEGGYQAMKQLLHAQQRPTAIFASNDPSAVGAIRACLEAGLSVPGDVSIVGAGCIESSSHPFPFLTTIDWPRVELGRSAGEMLLRLTGVAPGAMERESIYAPALVIRQSTREFTA